jgi:peptidoglycan/xylan/chitin deacetylase (PgdA/CDA1 family)
MKMYFLIPEHGKKNRLEYIIQLAGNILGYPWKIITTLDQIHESGIMISYTADQSRPISGNIPEIKIFYSGQLDDLKNAQRDIRSFGHGEYSIPVLGKWLQVNPAEGWQEHKQYRYYSKSGVGTWLTGFDLFVNIFYHISRFEEHERHAARETVADYSASVLARDNQLHVPVVDVLLDYFDQLIRLKINEHKGTVIRVMNWPGGELNGVALTHDVDLTRGVSFKKRAWKTSTGLIRKMFGDRETLKANRAEMNRQDARVWSYPQLLEFYSRRKWKATFFFLTKMFEGIHYRYNIESPQFQDLFNDLKHHNHEIGLHSSLNAFKHRKKYQVEKRKLEAITGSKCAGLRQHYLRALYPGLWQAAEAAHFAYDSSLAYNFQAGFRAGTAHPFFTFNWEQDRSLALLEFSLAFFDHNLVTGSGDLSAARQRMQHIIEQVSRFHGLLVVLLHPSNFLQPRYRELWDHLIAELDQRKVYVDTLSGHYKWFKFKEHIEIFPELQNKSREFWIVKKPVGLRTFSIEVIGSGRLQTPQDIPIEQVGERSYTISTDKTKMELVLHRS